MPIEFDTDERGLQLFRNLKADLESNPQRLTESLPIFLRIVVTENGGGTRWRDFNRYDLLSPIPVPPGFPKLRKMFGSWSAVETLDTARVPVEEGLSVHAFLASCVISIGAHTFTVQDFVSAIAYHRGLHNAPEDPTLSELYFGLIKEAPHWSTKFLHSIAQAFVRAYSEPYEHFAVANGNLSCYLHGRQPTIFADGRVEVDGALFHNSYEQVPLPLLDGDGLRVSLRLKLPKQVGTGGFIFSAGHRDEGALTICLKHAGSRLVAEVARVGVGRNQQVLATASVEASDQMTLRHFVIEVAYYARGFLVVAVDEWTKAHELVDGAPHLTDGKLVLGANLEGERGALFNLESSLIERIRDRVTTGISYASSLRRLPPYQPTALPHRALQRPNMLSVAGLLPGARR